jgi:signal transduction histidine kinase
MTVSRWRSPILHLVLTQASIFLVSFLILGNISYLTLSEITEQTMERTLKRDLVDLDSWHSETGVSGLHEALEDRSNNGDPQSFYALGAASLTLRVPDNLILPDGMLDRAGWHHFDFIVGKKARPALAYVEIYPDGTHLLVGHIAWERERLTKVMQRELGAGLLLVLLMAAGLAFVMSRAIARALAGPLAVADRFAGGVLDVRATPNGSGDSFDRLAQTLNAMFIRIQDLVGGIAHTTDAIAHDLRTPLARLKTRLEEAHTMTAGGPADAAIEAALAETDRVLATFQAMLRLARLEGDTSIPEGTVDMEALVRDAGELFEALAEEKQQTLTVTTMPIPVHGDRDQLFQLLVNLLDNAVKYAPANSAITLSLKRVGNRAILSVADQGPGIREADRERVFDRFVRLEAHRGSPGNGLGLALVQAIVRHHGGFIRLESAQPGLRVVVEFPCASHLG